MKEKLAKLAHSQWSGWMGYLFSKCIEYEPNQVQAEKGALIIPKWAVDRWRRQAETDYSDLSKPEMESDRAEADKFLAVFQAELAAKQRKHEITRKGGIAAANLLDDAANKLKDITGEQNIWKAIKQLATAKETNRKLHRRCQLAESAVKENIEACKRAGQSLGRRLSAAGYLMVEAENAAAKRKIETLEAEVVIQKSEAEIAKQKQIQFQNTSLEHYGKALSKLATEQEKVKRLRWFVMSMRDVLSYNEYSVIDMDVLFKCFRKADCEDFTRDVFGEITKMLLESGLSLLPTTNKAIRLYGSDAEKQALKEKP